MSMSDTVIEIDDLWKFYYLSGRRPKAATLRQRVRALLKGSSDTTDNALVAAESGFWALREVNLAVSRGEVLGVIGRNGAGKSTLLKILSRITAPTRGRVVIRGRVCALLEVGTGFHEELTGRENVFLNGTILGMSRQELSQKFDDIIAFAGIGRFIDTPVKHYSSGMRVRLGFSVAAHIEPEILIIDEVLAVGDLAFQEKCVKKVNALTSDEGRTVIFVSHSMTSVASLCPRVVWLESGQIVEDGLAGDVINHYHGKMHAEAGTADLKTRVDRTGSGVLRFTGVYLADDRGQKITHAISGSPVNVVLEYQCKPGFEGPADLLVNIVFSNTKGVRLFGVPSDAIRHNSGIIGSTGQFTCRVREFPVLPGNYEIDIACLRNRELADKIMQAATITVLEGDPFGTGALPHPFFGDVIVHYGWEFEPTLSAGANGTAETSLSRFNIG